MVNVVEVGDIQVNICGINGLCDVENSFVFIVDGVLMMNFVVFNCEFVNFLQIEVMKGLQGVIYGCNVVVGVIIVMMCKVQSDFEGQFCVLVVEDLIYVGVLMFGGMIGDGDDLFFVYGNFCILDGFCENIFLGCDDIVDDYQGIDGGVCFIFQQGDSMVWDFKVCVGMVEVVVIIFNVVFVLFDFVLVFGIFVFFEDVNDYEFIFQLNIDLENNQDVFELLVKVDQMFDWGNFFVWVFYSDIENDFFFDGISGVFGFFNNELNCISIIVFFFD